MTGSKIVLRLQQQHQRDLKVYRVAHQNYRNRILHWFLVPVECWTFFLLVSSVLPPLICFVAGMVLGILAIVIAYDGVIGWACLFFHLFVVATCHTTSAALGTFQAIILALFTWTFAWTFQVGIGHMLWEKNEPNVANVKSVSILSMCQSVLIAWSS